MDFALKAALTASLITTVILVANWLGDHAAGLLSGLPFTTLPALLLIGLDHGPAAAADAAVGGVVGCALASMFALAYHGAARRLPPLPTLVCSILCLTGGLLVTSRFTVTLPIAGLSTCAFAAGALWLIRPHPMTSPAHRPKTPTRAAVSALAIGVCGAGVTMIVIALSPSLGGTVAAMPLLGIATAATTHAARGRTAVPRFLRGYVISSLSKTAFCAVFAMGAPSYGIVVALLAASVSCGFVCMAALCLNQRRHVDPEDSLKSARARAITW